MRKKLLKIFFAAAAVVGVCLILNANLLFPWQKEARKNKRAAFEYIDANRPGAKFIRAYYRTTKFNPENNGYDSFYFEQNGIRFPVVAENGEVANDFYWKAFADHQLYNTYIKPFAEPRNITAKFTYSHSGLQDFLKNPNADISQFKGSVDFKIYDDKSTYPKSMGWPYDFYCYCKESIPFSGYSVTIICLGHSITFTNEREFENEDDFYNSFH